MLSFFLVLYLSLLLYKSTDHGSLKNGTILLAAKLAVYSTTESEQEIL